MLRQERKEVENLRHEQKKEKAELATKATMKGEHKAPVSPSAMRVVDEKLGIVAPVSSSGNKDSSGTPPASGDNSDKAVADEDGVIVPKTSSATNKNTAAHESPSSATKTAAHESPSSAKNTAAHEPPSSATKARKTEEDQRLSTNAIPGNDVASTLRIMQEAALKAKLASSRETTPTTTTTPAEDVGKENPDEEEHGTKTAANNGTAQMRKTTTPGNNKPFGAGAAPTTGPRRAGVPLGSTGTGSTTTGTGTTVVRDHGDAPEQSGATPTDADLYSDEDSDGQSKSVSPSTQEANADEEQTRRIIHMVNFLVLFGIGLIVTLLLFCLLLDEDEGRRRARRVMASSAPNSPRPLFGAGFGGNIIVADTGPSRGALPQTGSPVRANTRAGAGNAGNGASASGVNAAPSGSASEGAGGPPAGSTSGGSTDLPLSGGGGDATSGDVHRQRLEAALSELGAGTLADYGVPPASPGRGARSSPSLWSTPSPTSGTLGSPRLGG